MYSVLPDNGSLLILAYMIECSLILILSLTPAVASCDRDSWYSTSDSESGRLHLSLHLLTTDFYFCCFTI